MLEENRPGFAAGIMVRVPPFSIRHRHRASRQQPAPPISTVGAIEFLPALDATGVGRPCGRIASSCARIKRLCPSGLAIRAVRHCAISGSHSPRSALDFAPASGLHISCAPRGNSLELLRTDEMIRAVVALLTCALLTSPANAEKRIGLV